MAGMAGILIGLLVLALFLYGVYLILGLFKMPENIRYTVVVVLGIVALILMLEKFGWAPW